MSYSWSSIDVKEVVYLRNEMLIDFQKYLCENSDSVTEIWDNVYRFGFDGSFYYFERTDKYYSDLCFELAIELVTKNIDLSNNDLDKIYEYQKYKIMDYLFLIFTKKIERKLKKDEVDITKEEE